MGAAYRTLSAPTKIDVIVAPEATLKFLAAVRRVVLVDNKRVLIDLSATELISAPGCLLLTAEIERCLAIKPGSVKVRNPDRPGVGVVLELFGFHARLGFAAPSLGRIKGIAQIRSGKGQIDDLPETLGEVAELARETWGDQALTDRVHAALNEAMTNVLMHAYAPDLIDAQTCVPGRWWVAGIVSAKPKDAYFIALDQGAGIPRTAQRTYKDLYEKYKIDSNNPSDALVLSAAIQEGGSRTGLAQHGRGLPSMINLIKEKSSGGYIYIVSRRGSFFYRKQRADKEPVIKADAIAGDLAGTLIVWKVEGPIEAREA